MISAPLDLLCLRDASYHLEKKKKKRLEIFQPLKEEGFYLILKHVACK